MTALLVLSIFVVVCLSASVILIAVAVSYAIRESYHSLDRAHKRWVEQVEDLQNRLMAKDWEQYLEIKAFDASDEGGFITPEEQETVIRLRPGDEEEEVTQLMPPGWGGGQRNADIPRPDADEERLLAEDFDDDDSPRRSTA